MRRRRGADDFVFNGEYFSNMGIIDWIGVALMTPFLLAMLALIVYLIIGMIGSGPRRRRLALRPKIDAPKQKAPRQAPGD